MADLLLTPDLRRITVTLATEERDALRVLAFQERRDTRQQAALIIRRELERRGLLPTSGDFRPTEVQDAIAH